MAPRITEALPNFNSVDEVLPYLNAHRNRLSMVDITKACDWALDPDSIQRDAIARLITALRRPQKQKIGQYEQQNLDHDGQSLGDNEPQPKLGHDGPSKSGDDEPQPELGPNGQSKIGEEEPKPKLGQFKVGDDEPQPKPSHDGKCQYGHDEQQPKLGHDEPQPKPSNDGKCQYGHDEQQPKLCHDEPQPKLGPDGQSRLGDDEPEPKLGHDEQQPNLGDDGKQQLGHDGHQQKLGDDGLQNLGNDGQHNPGDDGQQKVDQQQIDDDECPLCCRLYEVDSDAHFPVALLCGHTAGATCLKMFLRDSEECFHCGAKIFTRPAAAQSLTDPKNGDILHGFLQSGNVFLEDQELVPGSDKSYTAYYRWSRGRSPNHENLIARLHAREIIGMLDFSLYNM